MQVFKYYFKLVQTMRNEILLYIGIFLLAMFAMSSQMPATASFSVQKPNVVIEDRDNSVLTRGIVDYVTKNAHIVSLPDTQDARKDAIYFQSVDAIYVIPSGFTADFNAGRAPTIETTHGTGQAPIQADSLMSNYLRLATPRVLAHMDQPAIVSGVNADLEKTITVTTKGQASTTDATKAMYHMNLEAYLLLGLNIMIISFVMLSFTGKMVHRRNVVSGTPYNRISTQLLAGNAVFSLTIWAVFYVFACIMYPSAMLGMYGLLYGASSLIFTVAALAIGFMVGSLLSNRRTIAAITNVLALGMSFLCGVFVPQQLLGDSVVNVSKALPAYWYVNANDMIAKLTDINWTSVQPILIDWLVILAFAAALFVTTTVLIKRKAARAS